MVCDKTYIIDTNVFRYYANSHSKDVQPFWKMVKASAEYSLFVCDETVRELTIQAMNQSLMPEIVRIKHELFPCLAGELSWLENAHKEYNLRLLASYIKYQFGLQVPTGPGSAVSTRQMEYPDASDARIILTAIANSCGIVTCNLKHFAILAVFGFDLWDPITDKHVEIDSANHQVIRQDAYVQKLLQRLGL